MTKISTKNKVGIDLSIEEIRRAINEKIRSEYDEEKIMLITNTIYNSVNNFYRITKTQLDEQIAGYGFTNLGENTKPGDICWYNGENMCDKGTVENYFKESSSEDSDDPHDIIKDIINGFALLYFPTGDTVTGKQ